MLKPFKSFKIEQGTAEHISFSGIRQRKPTVLIRVGSYSMSKRALQLGALLVLCQVLDGVLTYAGLSMLGVSMEGNSFLRIMMEIYGTAPILVIVKIIAVVFIFIVTIQAHTKRWLRPVIAGLILIYLAAAIIPWTYIISSELVRS